MRKIANAQRINNLQPAHSISAARSGFRALPLTLAASVLLLATAVLKVNAALPDHVPGVILLKAKAGLPHATVQDTLKAHGAESNGGIPALDIIRARVPENRLETVLAALQHNPNLEFAEPDLIFAPALTPNDTYYSMEWHLPKIQAPQAWDFTIGAGNVIIAVLDSGIDATHPDLAGQLVTGWNLTDDTSNTADVTGHGTGVAGNLCAAGNNATGVASPAWACKIMPIRVTDINGYASLSTIATGLQYATDHGARVANASFAISGSNSTLSTAAQYFQAAGGVVTVAAGNDSSFDATADDPYLLRISATDSSDVFTSFSATGNNIDLCAPGVNIVTTTKGGGYGYATGTSASAPLVAGVAALMFSVRPDLTGAQAQQLLQDSADDLGSSGWDSQYGYGRLNAYRALQAAINATDGGGGDTTSPSAAVSSPVPGSTLTGTVTVNLSASDNVGVTQLDLLLDGAVAASFTASPASFAWDTTLVANGSHTIQARAHDAAGNSGNSATVTVTVHNTVPDTSAPTAQITSPAAGAAVAGTVPVSVGASDNIGVIAVELYVDGTLAASETSAPAAFSWNTTPLPNGQHTLQARAYDAAGNVGTSASVTVTVNNPQADTTVPVVQVTSPKTGTTVSGNVTVSVSASDNISVTKVEWYLNGKLMGSSTSATASFTWRTRNSPAALYKIEARAYDAAGNVGLSPAVTVQYGTTSTTDTTSPSVNLKSPSNGSTVGTKVQISAAATDNVAVSRVELWIDGKLIASSTSSSPTFNWSTAKTAAGPHNIQALAFDAAGNKGNSPIVIVYTGGATAMTSQ